MKGSVQQAFRGLVARVLRPSTARGYEGAGGIIRWPDAPAAWPNNAAALAAAGPLRVRARHAAANNPLARRGVDTLKSSIVGTVQRPGDWPKFRWNDYDGEALRITQGKTDKGLFLPCTDHLRAALESAPKLGLTILTRQDGRPLPYRRMAEIMRQERERLGLLAYDLHALRYRGVMELAWHGCDDDEIASYSGHASKDMIRKYAGEARQMMRARQAHAKRR